MQPRAVLDGPNACLDGVSDPLGGVAMGGDVVVVEGDPVADIRSMRRVRAVFRDGALLVEDGKLA